MKIDILLMNIIALICFVVLVFLQIQEASALVDGIGNLF